MEFSHNSIKFQWYFRIGRLSFIMIYFATRYPKNMIDMSFYRPSYTCTLQQNIRHKIWRQTRRYLNSWSRYIQINEIIMKYGISKQLYESQLYFRLGTQSWITKILATAYPKNTIDMSFDRKSRVLFSKIFVMKSWHQYLCDLITWQICFPLFKPNFESYCRKCPKMSYLKNFDANKHEIIKNRSLTVPQSNFKLRYLLN